MAKHVPTWFDTLKSILLGSPRNIRDKKLFHQLSLIAFFAWVGLGADPLSSSCYGPEEMFLALKGHYYLAIFVALMSAATIFVISASYSQIVEIFPTGGGGYVVASKLLSPTVGMIAGCALLVDYVLTITISIASGADALFSFLPEQYYPLKLLAAILGVLLLTFMNLRGVKEAILPLVPVFATFLITHVFVILYAIVTHLKDSPAIALQTVEDLNNTYTAIGATGVFFLLAHSYSMGAGTYTGIEAVSNGLAILREPKTETAKRTMRYMAFSLSFTVVGLILAYLLFQVSPTGGKTLNAVLFENITGSWPTQHGKLFVAVILASETALLFIAAQAGFLDGPRVLANMANDRWMPTSFSALSDRLVSQNGVILMGMAAAFMMILTAGRVRTLVVLYSINVFITFVLSQAGMVRYWIRARGRVLGWGKKLLINGTGFLMCAFILISVVIGKFHEGGWITLIITGALVAVAYGIKSHYNRVAQLLKRLDNLLVTAAQAEPIVTQEKPKPNPNAKTAVILVNGYNGLGLHTLFNTIRFFGGTFKNFVFIRIGVIDAETFKGADEIDRLEENVKESLASYVNLMNSQGYYAEYQYAISNDMVEEITKIAKEVTARFGQSVFFAGQLVFPDDTLFTRWLHGYKVFLLQRRLYQEGIPLFIEPIRV